MCWYMVVYHVQKAFSDRCIALVPLNHTHTPVTMSICMLLRSHADRGCHHRLSAFVQAYSASVHLVLPQPTLSLPALLNLSGLQMQPLFVAQTNFTIHTATLLLIKYKCT